MFPVIVVPSDASESIETIGSKRKFWFQHPEFGRCLYKVARSDTGEDWSEKIAEQLCVLLSLPHARYEMASWYDTHTDENTRGVLSPTLVPDRERLILGNELLVAHTKGYPATDEAPSYGLKQYTLDAALALIDAIEAGLPPQWEALAGIETPLDLFVGYLFLDALIGNTDRHHENWAFIEQGISLADCAMDRYLAPTFDHASCLGRNESDANRKKRLHSQDPRYSVTTYTAKARSALYGAETDSKPLTVLEAFRRAAQVRPQAAGVWIGRLARFADEDVRFLFERVPVDRLSLPASEFAQALLKHNRHLLQSL